MDEFMKKIELLWGTPIFYIKEKGGVPRSFGTFPDEESPFICEDTLIEKLVDQSMEQELPVVYRDEYGVYFICVRGIDGLYLAGPNCTEEMDFVQLHRFYKHYHMSGKDNRHPDKTSLVQILNFASVLCELTGGRKSDAMELLKVNSLVEEEDGETEKEDTILELHKLDDEVYHHTYQEERYLLDCVREGRKEEAQKRMEAILGSAGLLSQKQINHIRNLAVTIVTVTTREAIAGGVSPAKAYRISDILINQIDKCRTEEGIVEYIRKAIGDFAESVKEVKRNRQVSNYTEQCKDYIYKNYHCKIYLEDVAEAIGISQGHLSRVFHEDTGMSIQEYILRFRVERAANLLRYSEASLMEISDYVCFHSQSHFGSVFKKYMNMTPGQYRNQYKTKEFQS